MCLNIYSMTLNLQLCNSDSFESATTYFFRCPDDLGNSKWRKKVVALSKVLLLVTLLNVQLIVLL